jgi:hypothetical protein
MKTLKEKLNLTPDQFEHFDSLPPESIQELEALHPAIQELIGERWRATKEVRETNFRGTPEDRFKAWRDHELVCDKMSLLTGINENIFPRTQPLTEDHRQSIIADLRKKKIPFKVFTEGLDESGHLVSIVIDS